MNMNLSNKLVLEVSIKMCVVSLKKEAMSLFYEFEVYITQCPQTCCREHSLDAINARLIPIVVLLFTA